MEKPHAYHNRNTMALLSLLGFSNIRPGRNGCAKFNLFEDEYEAIRFPGEICLGLILSPDTDDELYALEMAAEDMLTDNSKLQCYYSIQEDVFKLRLWVPCEDSNHFGAALRLGIEELESLKKGFNERVLEYFYSLFEDDFKRLLDTN